jgi:hypothetical protein
LEVEYRGSDLEVKLQFEVASGLGFDEIQIARIGIGDLPQGPSPEPRIPIKKRPDILPPL